MTVVFLSRGDTTTPVKALFVGVAVNVGLKVLLMDRYAQVGLAFATSVGAWINLALLVWFAQRQNLLTIDRRLRQSSVKIALAGAALALALLICERPAANAFASLSSLRDVAALLALAAIGGGVYAGAVLVLFRRQWRTLIGGRAGVPPQPPPDEPGMA